MQMLLLCMLRAGLEGWAVCRLVGEVAGPQTPTEACTWVCGTALAVCKIQGGRAVHACKQPTGISVPNQGMPMRARDEGGLCRCCCYACCVQGWRGGRCAGL